MLITAISFVHTFKHTKEIGSMKFCLYSIYEHVNIDGCGRCWQQSAETELPEVMPLVHELMAFTAEEPLTKRTNTDKHILGYGTNQWNLLLSKLSNSFGIIISFLVCLSLFVLLVTWWCCQIYCDIKIIFYLNQNYTDCAVLCSNAFCLKHKHLKIPYNLYW